jgi:hypothetical protein
VEYGSQDRNDKGENRGRTTQEPKPISFEGKGPGEKVMGDHINKRKDKSPTPEYLEGWERTFKGDNLKTKPGYKGGEYDNEKETAKSGQTRIG